MSKWTFIIVTTIVFGLSTVLANPTVILRAEQMFEADRLPQGIELLESTYGAAPTDSEGAVMLWLFQTASAERADGDVDSSKSLAKLEALRRRFPNSVRAQLFYGALVAQTDNNKGIKEVQKAVAQGLTSPTMCDLAYQLFRTEERVEDTFQVLDQWWALAHTQDMRNTVLTHYQSQLEETKESEEQSQKFFPRFFTLLAEMKQVEFDSLSEEVVLNSVSLLGENERIDHGKLVSLLDRRQAWNRPEKAALFYAVLSADDKASELLSQHPFEEGKDRDLWLYRTLTYRKLNQWRLAEPILEKLFHSDFPEWHEAARQIIDWKMERKEFGKALEVAKSSSTRAQGPEREIFLFGQARALASLKRLEEAKAVLEPIMDRVYVIETMQKDPLLSPILDI